MIEKDYKCMVETMLELVWRGPMQESLVKRIAKAGNVTEVTKQIDKLRKYAKGRTTDAAGEPITPKPRPRKSKPKKGPQTDGEQGPTTS